MKFLTSARRATVAAVSAAMLAACGGGSGSSDTLPIPSDLAAAGFTTANYSYAQDAGQKPSVKQSVVGPLEVFEATIPAESAGNSFAGFGAIVTPPESMRNFVGKDAIEVILAATAAPASGPTRAIKVQLKTAGVEDNGCLPTATVNVPESPTPFVLALNAATFPLPSFCSGPTAKNPAITGALPNVVAIQVEDGTIAARAVASKISVGKIAFAALPPVDPDPVDPPTPSLLAAAGFTTGNYGYAQDASTKPTVAQSVVGVLEVFEATIPASSASNTFAGFGAIVTNPASMRDFTGEEAIEVNLAAATTPSSGPTRAIKVQLKKAGSEDTGCFPTATVNVPESLTKFVLALNAATFQLPSFCTANESNPAIDGVLSNVVAIQVEDGTMAATPVASKISIGQIAFATLPPVEPVNGILVGSFSESNLGAYGFGYSELGGVSNPTRTFVAPNLVEWSSNTTGTVGGFGGSVLVFTPSISKWTTVTQMSMQLSSESSTQFRIALKGPDGGPTGNCQYLKRVGGISTSVQTITFTVTGASGFSVDPDSGCGATPPTLAELLANVAEVRVVDENWNNSNLSRVSKNRVGDVRVFP